MVNMMTMPLIEVEKKATLTGHRDCIYTLEKSGVNHQFFSTGGDGMVVLWDINNPEAGELIAKVENSVYALRYIAEKNHLLIGQNFKGIHLVDVVSKKEIRSAAITNSYIFDITLLKDKILVGTGDGTLVILSAVDLSTIIKLNFSTQSLRSIALSPDENYIALGFSDNFIRILETTNFTMVHEINAHQNSVFSVTFSPDGKYLLSGSRDAHLKIWEVKNNFLPYNSIVAHMYAINHIEYHPSGNYFATCSMDKSIKIWDAHEFRLLKVIDKARHTGHATSINKLYWSQHNALLLSASDDRSISIWDIQIN